MGVDRCIPCMYDTSKGVYVRIPKCANAEVLE